MNSKMGAMGVNLRVIWNLHKNKKGLVDPALFFSVAFRVRCEQLKGAY